jgi:rSAM/selenodomain-associated transferase 2
VTSLDVVIPTLNAAASLERTIASLRDHGHDLCLSIIVCDGGSSDDTVAVARRTGVAVATAQAGRGHQLAIGAAAGRAAWLLFLHADTVLERGWATPVGSFMTQSNSRDKAGFFRLRFASPDPRARRLERVVAWRSRRLGLPYGDQGLLLARAFYQRLGGFRPLPLMEDVDLVRRIGRDNLVALEADAITSARRYERDGWLVRPMRNLSCLALYFAGVPTSLLQRLYG